MDHLDGRLVLDLLPDAVVLGDERGRVRYVNAALERLLGWTAGELVGQPIQRLMPERMRELHEVGFRRYLRTRRPRLLGRTIRVPALRADGAEVEVELSLASHPAPAEELFIATLRDVGDQVELERQLAATKYMRAATAAAAKLTERLELQQVLATTVQTLTTEFDAALARIWTKAPDAPLLRLMASAGLSDATTTSSRAEIDIARYPFKVGAVARSRAAYVRNTLAGDAEFDQEWVEREQLRAVAVLPLLAGGELQGVMAAFFRRELRDEVVEVLGTFAAMVGTVINDARIFERERAARRELEFRTAQLELIMDAVPALISYVDADWRYRLVSGAYEAWFGKPRGDVVGRQVREVLGEAAFAVVRPHLERALGGASVRYEASLPYAEGARWTQVSYTPHRGPAGIEGVVALVQDITTRRRTEDALRFLARAGEELASSLDLERTLAAVARLVVGQLADACAVDLLDRAGTLRRVALHHDDPEVLAQLQDITRRFYAPPSGRSRGPANVVLTGEPEVGNDLSPEVLEEVSADEQHLRALSALKLSAYVCVPLRARGRVLGALTLVAMESGRRYDDDDLAIAEELARRAAYAIDNANLFQESQQAIRARGEFLSIASHELRTPLFPLKLQVERLAQLAQRDPDEPLGSGRVRSKIEMAERQIRHMETLVTRLLDVSRLSEERLVLEPEELELGGLVGEVLTRLEDQRERAGCDVTLDAPRPVVGSWDRLRLQQVVENLLSNALRYGAGSPIRIEVGERQGAAHLLVQDQGLGLSKEDQERVFGRFERAASEHHYGGLGLGLWITRLIVEAMGGAITVESEVGRGATFAVTLPKSPPSDQPPADATQAF